MFYRAERTKGIQDRLVGAPDLVVVIVFPSSRHFDRETKYADDERLGMHEYRLIDPDAKTMTFDRRSGSGCEEIKPQGDRLGSEAVPGFQLDLAEVREKFKPWK